MSSFVRRQPVRAVDLGTRPGLHGQVLISSGLTGMDKLLGGGLPLGSILLIIEDSHSQQHLNLMKCFMAEGFCCKHTVGWVSANGLTPESTAGFLPCVAKLQSSESHQRQAAAGNERRADAGTTASSKAAPDDGLKIAWQYRKYMQRPDLISLQQPDRSQTSSGSSSSSSSSSRGGSSSSNSTATKNVTAGISREWCQQFDLSKCMTPAQLQGSKFETYCCQQQERSAVAAAAQAAVCFVQRFQPTGGIPVPSRDPTVIGRLVIQSLGGPAWWPKDSGSSGSLASVESEILAAVANLRLQIQDATCAAVVTCPAGLYSDSFQARLQHLVDAVMCIQCLADNSDVYRLLPDPASASALMEVRRLPTLGLLRQKFIDDRLYLIRHKKRSISVSVLDLLPVETLEATTSEQKQQGANVPAVAKICGTGPSKGSALDF